MLRSAWRTLLPSSVELFALFAVCFLGARVYASPDTTMAVEPKIVVKAPGELFNVTVVVTGVTNVTKLFVWEFNLTFNPSVLEAVDLFEGPFLKTAGDTYLVPPVYNNAAGWVGVVDALFPYPENGAWGNGTLAYVTFRVKAEGKSNLLFSETKLRSWDPIAGELIQILHTRVGGLFQYPLLRDIAITGVISSATSVTVGQSVSINVTVTNRGNVSETFDVSISYDSTAIGTQTVNDLDPDAVDTVNFIWDTKNVAVGNHTITAAAEIVSGETNTADNTDSSLVVSVVSAFPIELVVGVILVVVVVLGVVGYFFLRRRSKKP